MAPHLKFPILRSVRALLLAIIAATSGACASGLSAAEKEALRSRAADLGVPCRNLEMRDVVATGPGEFWVECREQGHMCRGKPEDAEEDPSRSWSCRPEGWLSGQQVRDAFQTKRLRLQTCLELDDRSRFEGRSRRWLILLTNISTDGRVIEVWQEAGTVGFPADACILDEVRTMTFPEPEGNAPAWVRYRLQARY